MNPELFAELFAPHRNPARFGGISLPENLEDLRSVFTPPHCPKYTLSSEDLEEGELADDENTQLYYPAMAKQSPKECTCSKLPYIHTRDKCDKISALAGPARQINTADPSEVIKRLSELLQLDPITTPTIITMRGDISMLHHYAQGQLQENALSSLKLALLKEVYDALCMVCKTHVTLLKDAQLKTMDLLKRRLHGAGQYLMTGKRKHADVAAPARSTDIAKNPSLLKEMQSKWKNHTPPSPTSRPKLACNRKLALSPKERRKHLTVADFIDDEAKEVNTPQVLNDMRMSDTDSATSDEDESAVAEDDTNHPAEPDDHYDLGQQQDTPESPDILYSNTQVEVIESASSAPPIVKVFSKPKGKIPKRMKVRTPEFLDDGESDDFAEPPKPKRTKRESRNISGMATSLLLTDDMDDFPIIRDMECRSWNKKRKIYVCKTIDYFLAHETHATAEEYTDNLFATLYLGCENEQVYINLRNAILRKATAKCRGNWLSPDPMNKIEPKRLTDFIEMIKLCQMKDQWEELSYQLFKIMHTSDFEILTKTLTDDE